MRHVFLTGMLCVIMAACSRTPEPELTNDFFATVKQSADGRRVTSTLAPVDSFALSDYGVPESYFMAVHGQWIYARADGQGKILAVDRNDFDTYRFVGEGVGEGHGELLEQSGPKEFDVSDNYVVAINRRHQLARFSTDGTYVDESRIEHGPERLAAVSDDRVLTLDATGTDAYLILLSQLDGTVIHRIGRLYSEEGREAKGMIFPLQYSGFVDYHDGSVYYAAYAEPVIKKYALDGELLFSVATIDDFPTSERNYVVDGNYITYAPDMLFSSANVHAYGRYLIVQPIMDDHGETARVLDVYDADTGTYVRSHGVTSPPSDLAFDDEYLYMLQRDYNPALGEMDKYVKLYRNVLAD